jgi:uncharacterized protein YdiU (UPF0061 family)
LTLKGAVREILAAELLEALGVYTSKVFSVYETGESLYRGDEPSPTRSAVMTRLQHSHLRFGVFQRHAYFNDTDQIAMLVEYGLDHVLASYRDQNADPAVALLAGAVENSARLAAEWMAAGFVHGVLNTDNLVMTGESFDYGPWRFLPVFEPGFTAAYFDERGLYAYGRQPEAVYWALQQLEGALSLVADKDALIDVLQTYPDQYKQAVRQAFFARLGLAQTDPDTDGAMITQLLDFMKESQVSFQAIFFDWFCGEASSDRAMASKRAAHYKSELFSPLRDAIFQHEPVRPERLSAAYFNRDDPVDMVIETVESIWAAIAEHDDWSMLDNMLDQIKAVRTGFDLGAGRIGFLSG